MEETLEIKNGKWIAAAYVVAFAAGLVGPASYAAAEDSGGQFHLDLERLAPGLPSGSFTIAQSTVPPPPPPPPAPSDVDGDGVADSLDNCPDVSNAGQQDNDRDGFGNACDAFPQNKNKH